MHRRVKYVIAFRLMDGVDIRDVLDAEEDRVEGCSGHEVASSNKDYGAYHASTRSVVASNRSRDASVEGAAEEALTRK